MTATPSKLDIATKLHLLHELMIDVSVDMEYYGGFKDYWAAHAHDLAGAAGICRGWACAIELEFTEEKMGKL